MLLRLLLAFAALFFGIRVFADSTATFLSTPFTAGITAIDGRYSFWGNNYLIEQATKIEQLGSSGIFVYMTPTYATRYPEKNGPAWPGSVTSLTQLAQSAPYKQLFGMKFNEYVITTFTFANGGLKNFDPAVTSATAIAANMYKEKMEIYNFAKYLLQTYKGTDKSFVIKHWEGDWYALGYAYPNIVKQSGLQGTTSYDIPPNVVQAMVNWLTARQQGIAQARADAGNPTGVAVLNAVEVNRPLDAANNGKVRVVNAVVPKVKPDMVTYSSYDAVYGASTEATLTGLLQNAFNEIYKNSPDTLGLGQKRLMISELGLAERSLGDTQVQIRGDTTLQVSYEQGLSGVYLWTLFDNECYLNGQSGAQYPVAMQPGPPKANCKGFWMIDPTGATTYTYSRLKNFWATYGTGGGQTASVSVQSPTNNAVVGTSFTVAADATAPGGVTAMQIYLDTKLYKSFPGVSKINAPVTASVGQHKVQVKAWYGNNQTVYKDVYVDVQPVTVTISKPYNGQNVTNPPWVVASASAPGGVNSMQIYLDGNLYKTFPNVTSINAPVYAPNGSHKIEVKAWDNNGHNAFKDVTVTYY